MKQINTVNQRNDMKDMTSKTDKTNKTGKAPAEKAERTSEERKSRRDAGKARRLRAGIVEAMRRRHSATGTFVCSVCGHSHPLSTVCDLGGLFGSEYEGGLNDWFDIGFLGGYHQSGTPEEIEEDAARWRREWKPAKARYPVCPVCYHTLAQPALNGTEADRDMARALVNDYRAARGEAPLEAIDDYGEDDDADDADDAPCVTVAGRPVARDLAGDFCLARRWDGAF